MNIGKMDRQIVLQRKTTVKDSIGYPVETWATLATVWADVRPVSGREALGSGEALGRLLGSQTAQMFIHFYSGLTTADRISYDGKTWEIRYIREVGRGEMTEIVAEVIK